VTQRREMSVGFDEELAPETVLVGLEIMEIISEQPAEERMKLIAAVLSGITVDLIDGRHPSEEVCPMMYALESNHRRLEGYEQANLWRTEESLRRQQAQYEDI